MKALDEEIVIDKELQFEPTNDNAILYFVNCPHCGAEHTLKVFADTDEWGAYDFWCPCSNHFNVEYLPGVPNEKLLIY